MYQRIKFTKEQVAKLISLSLRSLSDEEVDLADARLDKDEYEFVLTFSVDEFVEMIFEELDDTETPDYAKVQMVE